MGTKNLFNVPSWTSVQELFFRRLGVQLDPTLVTYTYNPEISQSYNGIPLTTADGVSSTWPITNDGVNPVSINTGQVLVSIDWYDGTWNLNQTARTNGVPYSQDLQQASSWSVVDVVVNPSDVLYGDTVPYWSVTKTNAVSGANLWVAPQFEDGIAVIFATIALRATANCSSCDIVISGSNSGTVVTEFGANVSIKFGPASAAMPQTNQSIFRITGLSTTEDTLVILQRTTFNADSYVTFAIYPDSQQSVATGASILATRVDIEGPGTVGTVGGTYIPTNGTPVTLHDFAIENSFVGGQQVFDVVMGWVPPEGSVMTWSAPATFPPSITLTAIPTLADGSQGPYLGSITYSIGQLQITNELPPMLVWSDNFPMTVDALANYLLANYGYYMDDGEFIIAGDPNATPLVRGGGLVYNGLDALNNTFKLQATGNAIRWLTGSQVEFTVASSNSIVPPNGFAITSAAPPAGVLGQAYSYTYTVQNGTPPYTFAITQGTAPGSLNAGTGVLSSPELEVAANYSWIIQVTDSLGRIVTRLDEITVAEANLTFSPDTLAPVVSVGVPIDLNLGVSGGQPPYTFSTYLGSFPSGVSIQGGAVVGAFEGTLNPSSTQTTSVVGIQVTDSANTTIQRLFTFTINDRSTSAIQASLCTKVLHWFEYDAYIYDPGLNGDSNPNIGAGETIYDATGRANMQVALLPDSGPSGNIGLVDISRANQPYGFAFNNGAYAHNNTVAFNLPNNFAIMAMVNLNSNVVPGQKLISRGGDANGGYDVKVGADGTSLAMDLTLNGTPTSLPFPSQLPTGTGNWAFVIMQNYGNIPEMEVNAGGTVQLSAVAGNLTPNETDALFLGVDPALDTSSIFSGNMGMIGIFTDKLWSDERKWLYNQGSLQAFSSLGYWPTMTLEINEPISTIPLDQPFSRILTVGGGSGTYVNISWSEGSQVPPGLTLSYNGENTITIGGVPTVGGSYFFGVTVTSTDGQNQNYGVEAVVEHVLTYIVELPLTTAEQYVDQTGSNTWTPNGNAVISTAVAAQGALYLDGTDSTLTTPLTDAFNLNGFSYSVEMDIYPTQPRAYMFTSPWGDPPMPIAFGLDSGSGNPGDDDGMFPFFGWNNAGPWTVVRGTGVAATQNSWNTIKGFYDAIANRLSVFVNGQCAGLLQLSTGQGPVTVDLANSPTLTIGQRWDGFDDDVFTQGYFRNAKVLLGLDYDTLNVVNTAFASATLNEAYSGSLPITGGNGVYSNLVVTSGSVPPGLTLSLGSNALLLSGTAPAAVNSSFGVTFRSGDGQTFSGTLSINITLPATQFDPAKMPSFITLDSTGYNVTNNQPDTTTNYSTCASVVGKSSGKWTFVFNLNYPNSASNEAWIWDQIGIAAVTGEDTPPWVNGYVLGNNGSTSNLKGESIGMNPYSEGTGFFASQSLGTANVTAFSGPNQNSQHMSIMVLVDLDDSPQTVTWFVNSQYFGTFDIPSQLAGLTWYPAVSLSGTDYGTLQTGEDGALSLPTGYTNYNPNWG
jgi:hypothetical protein